MVDVDKAVIARKREGNDVFEILVDCERALELRRGKEVDMEDVLAMDSVFADAKKGLLASENRLEAVFGTSEPHDIARNIISEGDIQITAEHKKKIIEQKKKKILDYIHKNGVDPKTGLPHPLSRLELAFDEAGVHIDEYKGAMQQTSEIIKKLRPILPISLEKKELAVKIPAAYAARGYGAVSGFGTLKQQDWQTDGSWVCVLEIPAGQQNDLIDKLNSMTKGEVEVKTLK